MYAESYLGEGRGIQSPGGKFLEVVTFGEHFDIFYGILMLKEMIFFRSFEILSILIV